MQITIGKILSLLVALAYVAFAAFAGGVHAVKYCLGLVVPLAFIWFPEEIGSLTGYFDSGYVNVKTPALIMSFLGWFFLLGVPLIIFLLRRTAAG